MLYFGSADLASEFWTVSTTADGMICYVLTGVFNVNLKGQSPDWLRQTIEVQIPIPQLPANMGLNIQYWAPLFTLNAVYDQKTAVYAGFAVDSFGIADLNADPKFGQGIVSFEVQTAVSDVDAYLYRIGYNVTLLGTYKPLITPPIIN